MKRMLLLILLVIGLIGCKTIQESRITDKMPEEIAKNGGTFNR